VLEVYAAISVAVKRAREGQGPTLIESRTYRYKGHAKSDQNLYRSRDEIREWQQRDPIQLFVNYLISENVLSEEESKREVASAYTAIEEAYQFALGCPEPDPETLLEGVYA
jgi:pyruvate dehydrogenase E1 component alpha subunit